MWVRLTEQGDETIPADFGEAMPYKAERVVYDKDNRDWRVSDPELTFDPDTAASGVNIQLYVYETSGTIGLKDMVVWIRLQAFKEGTGAMFWAFSVNGYSQFAKIVSYSSGKYQAQQLDELLAPTGKSYDIDYPGLIPLNGKTDVKADTIVQVLKKKDQFYFLDQQEQEDLIAQITGNGSSPGEYTGYLLDGDMVQIPNTVFGTDLPYLQEVLGREHIPAGERVHVSKILDGLAVEQYFFRWQDPQMVMGS